MKKYNFQFGDLFVHYKNKKSAFYIQGMNKSNREFKLYWFGNENKHAFFPPETLSTWLYNGMYHYYPVKE